MIAPGLVDRPRDPFFDQSEITLTRLLVPTTKHILDHLPSIQRVLSAHDEQRSQAPVNTIEAQMLREVISQIFPLGQSAKDQASREMQTDLVQVLDVGYVEGDIQVGHCGRLVGGGMRCGVEVNGGEMEIAYQYIRPWPALL